MSGDFDTIEQAVDYSEPGERRSQARAALARVRDVLEAKLGEPSEDERQLRDLLNLYVPAGFRDDDGVWHGGPHRATAIATLERLAAAAEAKDEALRALIEAARGIFPVPFELTIEQADALTPGLMRLYDALAAASSLTGQDA